jgi:rhodanese-related sulfurtransferase
MKNLENILKASNNNIIVDVRTKAEFQEGHIKGSVNIPLDNISNAAEQLRKYHNIILVCASGMRSLQACKILAGLNMSNVYNGGSWTMLNGFIS